MEGSVSEEKSYLTPDEYYILTDLQIIPNRVIAGRISAERPTPGPSQPLTLTVTGGKYTVDGFTVYMVDHNRRDSLNVGGRYLLFLEPFGDTGRFQIFSGGAFEIHQQRVKPLLTHSEEAYEDLSAKSLEDLVLEIRRAAAQKE